MDIFEGQKILKIQPWIHVNNTKYWCVMPVLRSRRNAIKIRWQKQPPRQFSKISVLIFQEQPFYNFPGVSICSSNRQEFSRRVYMFFEQTRIFQEGLSIEKTCFFKEVLSVPVCRWWCSFSTRSREALKAFSRSRSQKQFPGPLQKTEKINSGAQFPRFSIQDRPYMDRLLNYSVFLTVF